MLGELQSGIQRGRAVDLENHWDLLDAATRFGRSFMQPPTEQDGTKADSSESQEGAATASNTIVKWLAERDVTGFYGKTNASSKQGLSLRIMMALFDERKNDESNTIEAINTLQYLDASKGELLQDDKTIHAKIVEAFFDDRKVIDLGTQSGMEEPVLPLKPYSAAPNTQVRRYLQCFFSYFISGLTLVQRYAGFSVKVNHGEKVEPN